MGKRSPVISVLMACHNGERWVADAISSVLSQSFADFEFVVVDDGSSDSSREIIEDYAARDPRVKLLRKAHTGLEDSLNRGIDMASGEWIARIDADDLCEPQRLEKQLAYASHREGLVFLGSGCFEIDETGTVIRTHRYPRSHWGLVRRLRRAQAFPPHSSAFVRAEALRRLGGYRTSVKRAQDWDLWLRLSEAGVMECLPDPLVRIRKHAAQVSLERAGREQLTGAFAAIASYFLRGWGWRDPLNGRIDETTSFRAWVEMRLEEEGVFARRAIWSGARTLALGYSNRLFALVPFLRVVCGSTLGMVLVKERLLGSNLGWRLAEEWVKERCAGS